MRIKGLVAISALLLSGCSVTVKHVYEYPLIDTNSKNELEEQVPCISHSLNTLVSLPNINVQKYKEKNDVNGLMKEMVEKLKTQKMLADIAVLEINECKSTKN